LPHSNLRKYVIANCFGNYKYVMFVIYIAVGDRMSLGMQDFNFAQIKLLPYFSILAKFAQT